MDREHFTELVEQALDSLPARFRKHIHNVAVLVEDVHPGQGRAGYAGRLLLGIFEGVPSTQKSVWDLPRGPDHIVLYQKNIEAVCSTDEDIREQVRRTVLHELGHYFGMSEAQLRARGL